MAAFAMALEPGAPVVCPTCDNERVIYVIVPGAPAWAARPCMCPACPQCPVCGEYATVADAEGHPSCASCAAGLVGHEMIVVELASAESSCTAASAVTRGGDSDYGQPAEILHASCLR